MKPRPKPPAIRLWCSNELERLAGRLIKNLEDKSSNPTGRLFSLPPIIVPNPSIATYLKYEFALQSGIAAGLKFLTVEKFLAELLPEHDKQSRSLELLSPGTLRSFFLEILSNTASSEPLPAAVTSYLDSAGKDRDALDLRRFQLASQLGVLANRYGEHRPGLLHDWANGRAVINEDPFALTEEWQRLLWTRVVAKIQSASAEKRWILPIDFFQVLGELDFKSPAEIHVFGFSYAWRGLREMFDKLRTTTTVNIYTFSPSEQLWDQLAYFATSSQPSLIFRNDPGLSLIENWARPGLEYSELLSRLVPIDLHRDFIKGSGSLLLNRLRREILQNSPENDAPFQPDESLTILGCPGIRREAEIVANEIWRLIEADDRKSHFAPERLRFCDIAVLLADSGNQTSYQAHLRAVFEELHGIPFNMVDLPIAGECHVVDALLLLLDLPMVEFNRPNVLKILTHPAVRARHPEAEPGQWQNWCLELEIVHGIDRIDHEGTYIDQNLFHWEQGLRRLVLGACMASADDSTPHIFRLENQDFLPYNSPDDALASVSLLLLLVRSLAADARFARSAHLTITQWSDFFAGMVDGYLGAEPGVEERARSAVFQKIQKLRKFDVSGRKFSYRTACESLRQELKGWSETRGHYLADGVVISPLKEMRSLPFRVVFLCGLGEGRFPAADGPDPLDLTLVRRDLGDVSPRERDKYLFLETLACARDRLYLSYVDRDAQTGDPLEPSSVVKELIRHLERGREGPTSNWIKKQPLRRFDDAYFSVPAETPQAQFTPFNCSPEATAEQNARELRKSMHSQFHDLSCLDSRILRQMDPELVHFLCLRPIDPIARPGNLAPRLSISIQHLRQFLECPLQSWARVMLKLREDEEEDAAIREDEPFVTNRLDQSALLREAFLDILNAGFPTSEPTKLESIYKKHAEARRYRGLLPIGLFGDVEERRHLAELTDWYQAASSRHLLEAGPYQICRFGRAAESEKVDLLLSPIVLEVPSSNQPQPVKVELFGRTEILSRKLPGSITPVVRDSVTDKDYLRGFLDAIVLRILQEGPDTAAYHVDVIPMGKKNDSLDLRRTFHGIDKKQARDYLISLLADLLNGPHVYLLPCEAAFTWISEGNNQFTRASNR